MRVLSIVREIDSCSIHSTIGKPDVKTILCGVDLFRRCGPCPVEEMLHHIFDLKVRVLSKHALELIHELLIENYIVDLFNSYDPTIGNKSSRHAYWCWQA